MDIGQGDKELESRLFAKLWQQKSGQDAHTFADCFFVSSRLSTLGKGARCICQQQRVHMHLAGSVTHWGSMPGLLLI